MNDVDDALEGLEEVLEELLALWREDQIAAGAPVAAVDEQIRLTREQHRLYWRQRRPMLERDLAVTAGVASVH
jgi:hypothetical protein